MVRYIGPLVSSDSIMLAFTERNKFDETAHEPKMFVYQLPLILTALLHVAW